MQAQDTVQVTEPKTPVQTDIEKIQAHIDVLKADNKELYADVITALEAKKDVLIAEVKAATEQATEKIKFDAEELKTKEATWAENFRTKHGVSWQVALVGGVFVVWQVCIVFARLLGVA